MRHGRSDTADQVLITVRAIAMDCTRRTPCRSPSNAVPTVPASKAASGNERSDRSCVAAGSAAR